jgi:hypothetical protein
MSLAPYALSVHHFISSVGADAGFASIIGLALLVLLYFAQARETSTLREQAETAAQRVAQLESRLAHAAAQSAAAARAAAAPPLPPGVQPPPATVAAAGRPAGLGAAAARAPAPPAGVAAPALSAATKLIPTPVPVGVAGVAAAGMAGTGGATVAGGATARTGAGAAPPAGTVPPAATAVPPVAALSSFSAPTTSPPIDPSTTPRPATAAGGAVGTNGTGEHPLVPPPFSPRQPVQIRSGAGSDRMLGDLSSGGSERSSSDLTRVLTALAAVAVVAAIVIVLLSVTSGGTSNHNASRTPPASNAPKAKHPASTAKLTPVNPTTVTVSVLNGTAVYHLADAIATQLGADGFKQGTVANAVDQTQPTTTIQYASGDQRQAAAVATALKLGASSVQPISPTTQQLGCAQNPTSCSVVVTVGADLANTQTQTTTTP